MPASAREEAERLVATVLAMASEGGGGSSPDLSGTAKRLGDGLGALARTVSQAVDRLAAAGTDPGGEPADGPGRESAPGPGRESAPGPGRESAAGPGREPGAGADRESAAAPGPEGAADSEQEPLSADGVASPERIPADGGVWSAATRT